MADPLETQLFNDTKFAYALPFGDLKTVRGDVCIGGEEKIIQLPKKQSRDEKNVDRPGVLLVSGLETNGIWNLFAPAFLEQGYPVGQFQLPGLDWSKSREFKADIIVAELKKFIVEFKEKSNQKEFFLIGHSLGAGLASILGAEREFLEKNGIKILGAHFINPAIEAKLHRLQIPISLYQLGIPWASKLSTDLGQIIFAWDSSVYRSEVQARKHKELERAEKLCLPDRLPGTIAFDIAKIAQKTIESLSELTFPVHVIEGEKDVLVRPMKEAHLARIKNHSARITLPDGSHLIPLGKDAESILALILGEFEKFN